MLLVAALSPAGQDDLVSGALIGRFALSGEAADAVSQLFSSSGDGTTGVLSAFLLVFSGVSLTRRMQRMYQQAWRLPTPPGIGHALYAALGLTALLLGIGLLYCARTLAEPLPFSGGLLVTVFAAASFLFWTSLPWLLLDRRIAWCRLALGGALTSFCTSVYGIASTIYMPRLLETYSRRYGLFGVTLALVGWLLAIAFIIVASAAVASEFDRARDPWARRLRRRFRIESAPSEADPPEALLLTQAVPRPAVLGRPGSSTTRVGPSAGAQSCPPPGTPTPD